MQTAVNFKIKAIKPSGDSTGYIEKEVTCHLETDANDSDTIHLVVEGETYLIDRDDLERALDKLEY